MLGTEASSVDPSSLFIYLSVCLQLPVHQLLNSFHSVASLLSLDWVGGEVTFLSGYPQIATLFSYPAELGPYFTLPPALCSS